MVVYKTNDQLICTHGVWACVDSVPPVFFPWEASPMKTWFVLLCLAAGLILSGFLADRAWASTWRCGISSTGCETVDCYANDGMACSNGLLPDGWIDEGISYTPCVTGAPQACNPNNTQIICQYTGWTKNATTLCAVLECSYNRQDAVCP
jgi:hypothetical protein